MKNRIASRHDRSVPHSYEKKADSEMAADNYELACDYYAQALRYLPAESPRRTSVTYKYGRALGLNKDPEGAFQAFEEAFKRAKRTKEGSLASLALLQAAQCAWRNARCDIAVSLVENNLDAIVVAGDSAEKFKIMLEWASDLAAVGRINEALAALQQAQQFTGRETLAGFGLFLERRAWILSLAGEYDRALGLFAEALEIMRRSQDPLRLSLTLGNYSVALCHHGQMQNSLDRRREAYIVAQQSNISWLKLHSTAGYAYSLFVAGLLTEAYDLCAQLRREQPEHMQGAITRNATGLLVGAAIGDQDFADQFYDPVVNERAFRSAEPRRVALMAAALHYYYSAAGRTDEAQTALEKGILAVKVPHGCAVLFSALLTSGAKKLQPATDLFQSVEKETLETRAFALLVAARNEQLLGNEIESVRMADQASLIFRDRLQWPLCNAAALEVAQRFGEAAKVYKSCGANAYANRLKRQRWRVGRPRRKAGQLTTRQLEVARLCAAGLRNHDIARKLGIGEGTVEFHLTGILRELGLTSRYEIRGEIRTEPPAEPAR